MPTEEIEVTSHVQVSQKNTTQSSLLVCDKIQYMHNRHGMIFDHHLVFWHKGIPIFKVWLKNKEEDKEYSDVYEALKDVGMELRQTF